jgi:hypothetical protein
MPHERSFSVHLKIYNAQAPVGIVDSEHGLQFPSKLLGHRAQFGRIRPVDGELRLLIKRPHQPRLVSHQLPAGNDHMAAAGFDQINT